MSKNKDKPILLLVDGNALIHRGFHALPHLSNKAGEPTNGVFGFAQLFLTALKDLKPEYVAVSFDLEGPTFRDELYDEYKATREKAPEELYEQIPRVKEMVRAFNMPIYEKQTFEADDVIGTLASQAQKEDVQTVILTGDYDTLQLVDKQTSVYAPKKGLSDTALFDEQAVREKYKLEPEQLVDYKALRGDPSDNIPGVAGVGEKTATKLLREFGNLKSIYEYLKKHPDGGDKVSPRFAKKLIEQKDEALLSRKLAKIVRDVPVQLKLKKTKLSDYEEEKVVKILQELEFKSLLKKLPKSDNHQSLPKQIAEQNRDYVLVDDQKKYKEFLKRLKQQKEFVLDTETTSESPMEADLLGIGFGWEEGKAYYVPVEIASADSSRPRNDVNFQLSLRPRAKSRGKQSQELCDILQDPKIKKIGHNLKYDYAVLKRAGIKLRGVYFDTMIAAYLLNPGARGFDLDSLAFTELGQRMQPIEELLGPKGKDQKNLSEVAVKKVSDYCCEDVDMTWQLKNRLSEELKDKDLEKVFYEIDMPLITVLAEMELAGIRVEPNTLKKLSKEADKEIEKLEQKIYNEAGKEFNIGSTQQLREVLFEDLDIPTEGIKKTKTGYSTAASELEKLKGLHPIIELISEWRELTKLKNTYLDALPKLINKKTDRIHTSFNQTITATGRLSSSDPNLQNIPVRTALGKQVRSAFVAEKGMKLLSVDYSQIELRIGAHLSEDKKMVKVFKAGGDIHTATSKEIFGTEDKRRMAKVINFGIFYGLSPYGLTSRIPEVSREEAEEFIEKFKEIYKELDEYLQTIIDETKKKEYVENELGRLRNLPEINSSQYQVRSAAERAAINMPLQSLAADIIKLAMNKLYEEGFAGGDECRLLLQVHDELLFETAEDKVEEHAKQIAKIMREVYKLRVPLEVEAKAGEDWEDMKKIELT